MKQATRYRVESRRRFAERDALLRRIERLDPDDPETRAAATTLLEQAQHAEYCAYEAERWADWWKSE